MGFSFLIDFSNDLGFLINSLLAHRLCCNNNILGFSISNYFSKLILHSFLAFAFNLIKCINSYLQSIIEKISQFQKKAERKEKKKNLHSRGKKRSYLYS